MSSSKTISSALPDNDEYDYSTYAEDILGKAKKKDKKSGDDDEEEANKDIYLFYDFRRGADNFPEGLEVRLHSSTWQSQPVKEK